MVCERKTISQLPRDGRRRYARCLVRIRACTHIAAGHAQREILLFALAAPTLSTLYAAECSAAAFVST